MRVLLADHHAQAHWALKTMLEEQPELDLVGEAVDAQGLLMAAKENPGDLALVVKYSNQFKMKEGEDKNEVP